MCDNTPHIVLCTAMQPSNETRVITVPSLALFRIARRRSRTLCFLYVLNFLRSNTQQPSSNYMNQVLFY